MKAKFLEVAKASTMITSIAKRSAKLDTDIQQVAMAAIFHCNTHNNASIGMNLIGALSGGTRRTSLIVYLCTHGKFEWNKDAKALEFAKRDDVLVDADALHAVLSANLWHDAVQEKDPSEYLDVAKSVASLIKRIQKATADGQRIEWGTDSTARLLKAVVVDGCEINIAE